MGRESEATQVERSISDEHKIIPNWILGRKQIIKNISKTLTFYDGYVVVKYVNN